MNHRRPILLSVLAAFCLLGAWALWSGGDRPSDAASQPSLLPGWGAALNGLTELRIAQGGKNMLLKRNEQGVWQVPEMKDYPADLGRVREFLLALEQSRLLEQKTALPENYAKLGLDEPMATRFTAVAGEKTVADLWLGNVSEQRKATYIRYPDKPETWLVSGKLAARAEAKQWVRQEVLRIAPARLKRVTIDHAALPDITVERADDKASFVLSPKPEGLDRVVQYQLETLPRIFTSLTMADVIPSSQLRASSTETTAAETFDGLTVRFRYNGSGADVTRWITIEADAAPEADESVKKEAREIAARTQGWAYRFPAYVMTQLRLSEQSMREQEKAPAGR